MTCPREQLSAEQRSCGNGDEAGLTLVELMVSLLLAAILAAGMFYLMAGQSTTYRQQMGTVSLQENLWGAMEYTQRQLRSAGFGFAMNCPGGRVSRWDKAAGDATMPSRIVGFQAFNDCNLLDTAIAACPDGSGADSFVVTAATAVGDGARLQANALGADAALLKLTASGAILANDLIVLSQAGDPYCTVVRATAAPVLSGDREFDLAIDSENLYNPGAGTGYKLFPQPQGYRTANTQLARFPVGTGPRYFAVDRSRAAPRLVTWMTLAEPSLDTSNMETVAQGVEDVQVAFACDDNANNVLEEGATADARKTDEWAANAIGETTPPVCNPARIGMIRITLTVRSDGPDSRLKTGFRPAAEDRLAGTPADDEVESGGVGTYPRRTLTALVRPRNL